MTGSTRGYFREVPASDAVWTIRPTCRQDALGYCINFGPRMLDKYLSETLDIHLPNQCIDMSSHYYDRK
jgi:hypothetical protein